MNLKTFFTKLKTLLPTIWKYLPIATILLLLMISAYQCKRINDLKNKQVISNQNITALNDSIKYEKTKNGSIQASIASFIATEKELKDLNKNLADQVKEQSGTIVSLNESLVKLSQDTDVLRKYLVEKESKIEELLKIDDHTYAAPWILTYRYDSLDYDIFEGKTYIGVTNKDPLELVHANTELTKRTTQIDLIWGQKVENDKLRVFIQSKYPGFTVAQLSGVLIDPSSDPFFKDLYKKKHWFSGFSVGIGATGGFNVTSGGYGLVIGPTLSWNIYNW